MPNAGNTPPGREAERLGRGDERLDGVGVDRLGAGQGQRQRRQVEVRRIRFERPGRQHPREVRAGGGRAAPVGDPLHPVARVGQEVLRRGLHERRRRVVIGIARKPTRPMSWYSGSHETITSSGHELGRLAAGVDVRRQHAVGDHHALRLARRAARVLQDHEPLGVGRRDLEARRRSARRARRAAPRRSARSAGRRAPPRRTRRAGRRSARAWRRRGGCGPRVDSTNASSEPIRIGSGSTIEAMPAIQQPRMIGDQRAARRPEDGDVVAGHEAPGLQRRADGAGLVVDLAPRTTCTGRPAVTDAPTKRTPVGGRRRLEPLDRRVGGSSTDASARSRIRLGRRTATEQSNVARVRASDCDRRSRAQRR